MNDLKPLVAVLMSNTSDWEVMQQCVAVLDEFGIPNQHSLMSAHRSPDHATQFAKSAADKGLRIIIAAGSGATHLPALIASHCKLPVIGVPLESPSLRGLDSLLSMVQMPGGVPVATVAIGVPGARNAALLSAAILALNDPEIRETLTDFRKRQTEQVLASTLE